MTRRNQNTQFGRITNDLETLIMKQKCIYLLFIAFFQSCIGGKKVQSETVIRDKTERVSNKKDSVSVREINSPIFDRVTYELPEEIGARVPDFNTSKESGANKSRIKKKGKTITFISKVGQTENKTIRVKETTEESQSDVLAASKYLKKIRGIPIWWIIVALIILFRKTIFNLLSLFFPALRLTKLFALTTGTGRLSRLERMQETQQRELSQLLRKLNDADNL